MESIHEQIDELLAADAHDQLSGAERERLHAHLVECAGCRQLHKETRMMNNMIDETLDDAKPDAAFEQRMLGGFRRRVPERGPGVMSFLLLALRSRASQVAAAAALVLALVQTGRMITGEAAVPRIAPASYAAADQAAPESDEESAEVSRPVAAPAARAVRKSASAADMRGRADGGARAAQPLMSEAMPPPPPVVAAEASRNAETQASSLAAKAAPSEDKPAAAADAATANRKLVRNARVDLEVAGFDEAVQKITAFAGEDRGYVATTSSEKQENGKLRGEVVVKVLPENLDRFLGKLRGIGELKNQSLTTEDVTKAYFDTDSRLKNARAMEQRLIEILKKKSDDINDLLAVEKELGRVREEIETMQGELKFMDAQVQFATVTVALAEKDMNTPAAFLLKERAQLALYTPDVEKVYNDIKGLASPKVQITAATLNRDNGGRVSARVGMLIAPEESDAVIARTKSMGRVENFQLQTERVARGGQGMGENAKTERDKVELNITISRDEQEQALQQTSLRIRTGQVNDSAKQLRELAAKNEGRVRSSSFSRDPDGREVANVSIRVPMKNYNALMGGFRALGDVENVSVTRQDRTDAAIDEQNAPADVTIQVYSQGRIVSPETGLLATLRRTIGQGASALMWSVRMIGVALAFFAPWVLALTGVVWIVRRIRRARARR